MRLLVVLCAVSLVAACPPRRGRAVYIAPAPAPGRVVAGYALVPKPADFAEAAPPARVAEVAPPPRPAAPIDPAAVAHLWAWEAAAVNRSNLRAEIALTRTDAVFKKASTFTGTLLLMKPNLAVLRLENTADPAKNDYEAYICDGKSVYAYNGLAKTITEFELPLEPSRLGWPWRLVERAAGELSLGFDMLLDLKADELRARFDVSLFKADDNYVYLDLKPRRAADRAEFAHIRVALYGPGPSTAKLAYLPSQVYVLKPNGDSEVWKFTNPQVNIPGVEPKHFQFVEVPGFKVQRPGAPPDDESAP